MVTLFSTMCWVEQTVRSTERGKRARPKAELERGQHGKRAGVFPWSYILHWLVCFFNKTGGNCFARLKNASVWLITRSM